MCEQANNYLCHSNEGKKAWEWRFVANVNATKLLLDKRYSCFWYNECPAMISGIVLSSFKLKRNGIVTKLIVLPSLAV